MGTISVPPPMPSKPEAMPPKKPSPTPKAIVFPDLISSASVLTVNCLSLLLFLTMLIIVRMATRMRKAPNTTPRRRSSIIVANHAPMYAPGAVVKTRVSPVL